MASTGRCDRALPLLLEARDVHLELFGDGREWVSRDDDHIADCEALLAK